LLFWTTNQQLTTRLQNQWRKFFNRKKKQATGLARIVKDVLKVIDWKKQGG
jgi:hypothetical protein